MSARIQRDTHSRTYRTLHLLDFRSVGVQLHVTVFVVVHSDANVTLEVGIARSRLESASPETAPSTSAKHDACVNTELHEKVLLSTY